MTLVSWITLTLLMFACSVAVYVAVRKAALDGLPSQFNNLAMFALPMLIFAVVGLVGGDNFGVSPMQLLEIAGTAVLFSYAGNALSMYSIAVAPNPGYSLLLSKSYVVFTTLWAVVFFDSTLTLRSTLAIGLIVVSSAVIMLHRSTAVGRPDRRWIPPAVGAFFCWGFLSLVGKHVQGEGVSTAVFLTYLFAGANLCILVEMQRRKLSLGVVRQNWIPFVSIGITAAGFNFANFRAIHVAPNVGFVNAANAASIGAVTVVAALLFGDELTPRKLAGVVGILGGLFLLFF
jgi:drug/metabolite transporter (DMT)-like permease